jgi:hypothetical protein
MADNVNPVEVGSNVPAPAGDAVMADPAQGAAADPLAVAPVAQPAAFVMGAAPRGGHGGRHRGRGGRAAFVAGRGRHGGRYGGRGAFGAAGPFHGPLDASELVHWHRLSAHSFSLEHLSGQAFESRRLPGELTAPRTMSSLLAALRPLSALFARTVRQRIGQVVQPFNNQ